MPEIYVVEGPAGSGKSYIIQNVEDSANEIIPLYDSSSKPVVRNYDGRAGLAEITVRDLSKIGEFLASGMPEAIFDRWIMGSFVYDHLRNEAPFPELDQFHHAIVGYIGIVKSIQGVLVARQRIPLADIGIHWMFNIPDANVISERRSKSNKEYPFPADLERDAYWQVYLALKAHINEYPNLGGIRMSAHNIDKEIWAW